jgi:hypothetical protein
MKFASAIIFTGMMVPLLKFSGYQEQYQTQQIIESGVSEVGRVIKE